MSTEIASIGESPVAVLTAEGFLTSVGSDVSLQQPGSRECFAAEVALARKRVRSYVHLEGSETHVDLFTVFARERFFGLTLGSGAVELLVFRQSGVCGVRSEERV